MGVGIAAISAMAQPQPPDTVWTKAFGGTATDRGYFALQTADGGFALAGYTQCYGAGGSDYYLVKTDADGDTLWTRTYGGTATDESYCLQQTADRGFAIFGRSNSFGAGSYDYYLIKTDSMGSQQWVGTYGGTGSERGEYCGLTSDGGYILTGRTASFGAGGDDIFLVRLNANGDTLWTRCYGGVENDWVYCVEQNSDGGFILTGRTYSYGGGGGDVYIIRTDAQGDTLWTRVYGGTGFDGGYGCLQTADGGFIIGGFTFSSGAGLADIYVLKTDANGDTLWTRTLGGANYDYGWTITETSDGSYVVAGNSSSYGAGLNDFVITKLDVQGNEIWTCYVGGNDRDYCYSVRQNSDGGYILAGYTSSFGAGGYDCWMVRFEPDEVPTIDLSLTPHNPPIQIPASGGNLLFDATIINSTSSGMNFDAWTQVILPSGMTFGPLIQRNNLSIPAGATIMRVVTQTVPGGAPTGNYTYLGYVGDYPLNVLDSDQFNFEKLAGESAENTHQGWDISGWFGDDESASILNPSFLILNSYPNPFNPSTALSYKLQAASKVKLAVYDITGREVATLVDGCLPEGAHHAIFDGRELASGVYFARLKINGDVYTNKLVLLK